MDPLHTREGTRLSMTTPCSSSPGMQVRIRLAEIVPLLFFSQPNNFIPSLIPVMNRTPVIRHYDPSNKRYHAQYTPNSTPTPQSPSLTVSQQPPASNDRDQPSRDPKTQPRQIVPAPPAMPAGDSKESNTGNSGVQKEIRFIPCSPP